MARTKSNPKRNAGTLKCPRKVNFDEVKKIKSEIRKKNRYRPGTVALREIRKQQTSTKTVFACAPFRRLVREIASDLLPASQSDLRITKEAFDALQAAAEDYLSRKFKDATTCAVINNRQAVLLRDWKLAIALDEGNKRPLSGLEYSQYTGLSMRGSGTSKASKSSIKTHAKAHKRRKSPTEKKKKKTDNPKSESNNNVKVRSPKDSPTKETKTNSSKKRATDKKNESSLSESEPKSEEKIGFFGF